MLNLNHLEFSAPHCPDIIVDGNQLILRLDASQEYHPTPIVNADLRNHELLSQTATHRDSTIGSFSECHLPENASINYLHHDIPNAVQVPAVTQDLLEDFLLQSSQTIDTSAVDVLMSEMVPPATQADNV